MFDNFETKLLGTNMDKKLEIAGKFVNNDIKRRESIDEAKWFLENLCSEIHVLRSFFDIKPKVGSHGNTNKTHDVTTCSPVDSFWPGYSFLFFVSVNGIEGFIIKECE